MGKLASRKRTLARTGERTKSMRTVVYNLWDGASASQRTADLRSERERNCRLLLVEDHEATRVALGRLLNRRHYEVISAGSIAEARLLMEKHGDFQLLIADIGLPDGSGFDLMAEFKKRFNGRGVALTGYGRDEDVARSRMAGFTAHLTKPVSAGTLDNALALAAAESENIFVKNGMPQ